MKKKKSKRRKKKKYFFLLCLCSGIWASGSPRDLHRLFPHHHQQHQQQLPPCWGVFSAPSSSRHATRPPALPRQKRSAGGCDCARGSGEWKCHIGDSAEVVFMCRRVVPTERSDAGVGVWEGMWEGTMDWYGLPPSLHVFPPPTPPPPHPFNSSWLPRRLFLPPSGPLVFFFFYPSMHPPFLLLSLSPSLPRLNAIMVMDFSPPRLMASDILSWNEANHALKGHV